MVGLFLCGYARARSLLRASPPPKAASATAAHAVAPRVQAQPHRLTGRDGTAARIGYAGVSEGVGQGAPGVPGSLPVSTSWSATVRSLVLVCIEAPARSWNAWSAVSL
jgi:hypothetical protein